MIPLFFVCTIQINYIKIMTFLIIKEYFMKHYSYPSTLQYRTIYGDIKHTIQYTGSNDENDNPIYDETKTLPSLDLQGTVKIHGMNTSIILDRENNYYPQSRENLLTIRGDKSGFAVFSTKVSSFVTPLLQSILDKYPEAIAVGLYGEWCGAGVQKAKESSMAGIQKTYVIFAIKIMLPDGDTHKSVWLDKSVLQQFQNESLRIYDIHFFKTFSATIDLNDPDSSSKLLTELTESVEKECPVAKYFGNDNMPGEGIVWHCIFNGETVRLKVKAESHASSKTSRNRVKNLAPIDVEKVNSVAEFVEYACTDNRCEQGLSIMRFNNVELNRRNTLQFINWVMDDITKEELDTLIKNNLTPRDVSSAISTKAKDYYLSNIEEPVRTYILSAESRLDWDDSEYSNTVLGQFKSNDIDAIKQLVDNYWRYEGEDILTDTVVKKIVRAISKNEYSFDILEHDLTVGSENCRRRFTFILN